MRLAGDLGREAVRYQGNWIPHKLRDATDGEIFFAGDSAGHCLPLTAEGIRTALYFGIACGREVRRVVEGRATRETALRRYHDFSASHAWHFKWMLRTQRAVPRIAPRALAAAAPAPSITRMIVTIAHLRDFVSGVVSASSGRSLRGSVF